MNELELARIIQVDRDRDITAALRWRRPRFLDTGHDEAGQPPVTEASAVPRTAGITSAASTSSARTSTGSARS